MRKLIFAAFAAATFCSGAALAADMATKAPPYVAATPGNNWTGWYVGLEGGGGVGPGRTNITAALRQRQL